MLSGVSTIHCDCDVYLTSRGFMSVSGPRAPGILPTIMSWTGVSMHYTFAMALETLLLVFPWSPLDFLQSMVQ